MKIQNSNIKSKRILIDGRFIGVGESMTRYCLELIKGILELDKESEYTLLVRPAGLSIAMRTFAMSNDKFQISNEISDVSMSDLKLEIRNLKLKVLDIPHYSLAEQTQLLKYLNREQFDLVHFIQFNHPIRYKGKFVVTIHDLTLLGHLHREPVHKRIAFGTVMKSAAKNSVKIITISETSKKEIIEYYGVPAEKIIVTYLAVDSKYQPPSKVSNFDIRISDFRKKYGISGEFFLYTGMWKKHKNLIRLLKAYEIFRQNVCKPTEGHGSNTAGEQTNIKTKEQINNLTMKQFNNNLPQLVLVGKIDKEEPEVIALIDKINKRIHNLQCSIFKECEEFSNTQKLQSDNCNLKPIVATGYIEEGELPIAYAGALAYIIPSLSEGFGLPPLEAMACGTPVLSSNVSAMPEILGQAPLYFDPYDVDDIAFKMQQVSTDGKMRSDLSRKGIEQAAKYDWAQTAKQTLEVYKSVLTEGQKN